MGQTTSEIESYIENKREDLGSNLQELEEKVKSMTDWKQQFQKNTMAMIGLAFGGGVLLATLTGGRRRSLYREPYGDETYARSAPTSRSQVKEKALETWDYAKGALIGLAASRAKDYVSKLVTQRRAT